MRKNDIHLVEKRGLLGSKCDENKKTFNEVKRLIF